MGDILPSRIEPLGDSGELPADARRNQPPKPKPAAKQDVAVPPIETEEDDSHQLDERA
jgi:hypothetical protein